MASARCANVIMKLGVPMNPFTLNICMIFTCIIVLPTPGGDYRRTDHFRCFIKHKRKGPQVVIEGVKDSVSCLKADATEGFRPRGVLDSRSPG